MRGIKSTRDQRGNAPVCWALLAGFLSVAVGGCAAATRNHGGPAADLASAQGASASHERFHRIDLAVLPQPRPEYKPYQVVQIIVDALQNNDAADTGIAIAFNFASPENRQATGSLERFISLVRRPAYGPLLNCRDVSYGTATLYGDQAMELVAVLDAGGEPAFYLLRLSRQTAGRYQGCWMTDGVLRIEFEGGPGATRSRGAVRI